MEGRGAIRGLELNKTKVSGLWSLPDEVALSCLVQLSRLDLAALAIASKEHRSLVVSPELRDLRWKMGCIEQSLYVFLHVFPEPNPRWFILDPVQRRLEPIHSNLNPAPETGSAFVSLDRGIYVIGGSIKGNRTSDVWFFDCCKHTWHRVRSMHVARSGASASLIDGKIYVFGGYTEGSSEWTEYSNWVDVFDLNTQKWRLLFVLAPTRIRQSLVTNKKEILVVDEDGQNFIFSPSKSIFLEDRKMEARYISDRCYIGNALLCGGKGGRIMWCFPYGLDWNEVKGLEELQSLCGDNDIRKLCTISDRKIAIFWIARPDLLELWSAEISLRTKRKGREIWGKIEWSGAILPDSSICINLLYATGSVFA